MSNLDKLGPEVIEAINNILTERRSEVKDLHMIKKELNTSLILNTLVRDIAQSVRTSKYQMILMYTSTNTFEYLTNLVEANLLLAEGEINITDIRETKAQDKNDMEYIYRKCILDIKNVGVLEPAEAFRMLIDSMFTSLGDDFATGLLTEYFSELSEKLSDEFYGEKFVLNYCDSFNKENFKDYRGRDCHIVEGTGRVVSNFFLNLDYDLFEGFYEGVNELGEPIYIGEAYIDYVLNNEENKALISSDFLILD